MFAPVKLRLEDVSMTFKTPSGVFQALAPVTLAIAQGRFVSLIGPSGCGKSTLFNVIAGLLEPSGGRVVIDGVDSTGTIGRVGYMLQKDLLLPWRTVLDNVILGMEIQGVPLSAARSRAAAAAPLRTCRLRTSLSKRAVRRHAPARRAVAHADVRHRCHFA
jgi:ABC-type nitrate/sulfonate/bicarbonate transport system ATPase subunit